MTILNPTKDLGATGMPVGITEIPPDQQADIATRARFAPGSGANAAYLGDLMSAFLAHEQCGVHLYRTVATHTANPMLEMRYREFLRETEEHVSVLSALIKQLGGDPLYVSPAARLVHSMNTHLMTGVALATGSTDVLVCELGMLEAVMLAETKDHANWSWLSSICEDLDHGETRDFIRTAVAQVEPQEDNHVKWARETWSRMNTLQTKSSAMMKITEFAENMTAKMKNTLAGN